METRELDLADDGALRPWWEAASAVDGQDRPWSWFPTWEELLRGFRAPSETWERHAFGAYEGGELVGGAHLQLALRDNLHRADVWVFVPAGRRRRGVGTLLLDRVLGEVKALGRDTVVGMVTVLRDHEAPGLSFGERHGFAVASTDGFKLLDLPATEDRWDGLAADAAPHHAGYRLVTWHDEVPAELLDGYCALQASFNGEAPMGDLDVELERWDEARVREKEQVFRSTGRAEVVTMALAPDGTAAGLTEVMVSELSPERAMQGGTIVPPAHRGHRLGLAMKVANQRALRARFPRVRHVVTANADVNAHMNAVNDRLGFAEVEQAVEMQRKL